LHSENIIKKLTHCSDTMRFVLFVVVLLSFSFVVSGIFCKASKFEEIQNQATLEDPIDKPAVVLSAPEEQAKESERILAGAVEKSSEKVSTAFAPLMEKGPYEFEHEHPSVAIEPGHVIFKLTIPYDELADKDAPHSTESIKTLRKKIVEEFRQISGSSRESMMTDFKAFEDEYQGYNIKVVRVRHLPPLMKKFGENIMGAGHEGASIYLHNDMEGLNIYLDISPDVPSEL